MAGAAETAGERVRLKTVYLKDQGLFALFSLPLSWQRGKSRRSVLRAWLAANGRESVMLAGESSPRVLLFLQRSLLPQLAARVFLLPEQSTDGGLEMEGVQDLAAALFVRHPELAEAEFLFPAPVQTGREVLPAEKTLSQPAALASPLDGPHYVAASGLLQPLTRIFLHRLSLSCHSIVVRANRITLLLHCNPQETAILSSAFLPDKSLVEDNEERQLLGLQGLLDATGHYQEEREEIPVDDFVHYAPLLLQARTELRAYLLGERESLDLPLVEPKGSTFQKKVWAELEKIPYGSLVSYGELAQRVTGTADAERRYARATGAACRSNPLAVFIPCHRVIGKRGELTGFAGGLETKARLLDLEILHYHEKA